MADKWELLPEGAKVLAVHAALLPSGKVLYFGGSEHDEDASSVGATCLWNPVTHSVDEISSPSDQGNRPEDLFCCGHCLLPTGNLLVAGGTEHYEKDAPALHGDVHHFTGIRSVNVFDWRDETWHFANAMSEGRWYPSLIVLHDGHALAMSGHATGTASEHENTKLEIFDPATGQWSTRTATMPPLEDTGGDYWILGHHIIPEFYYPRIHLLPNRQVFSSTALRVSNKRMTRIIDPATDTVRSIADPPYVISGLIPQEGIMENVYSRSAFASVMLPLKPPNYGVRILICGEKQAKFFEPNNEQLGWQDAGDERPYPLRAYLNAVLLPDATILVVGGAMSERIPGIDGNDFGGEDIDRIAAAERYHPDTNSWEVLSFPTDYEPIARVYHSVALLLPDGRVWIAGSNHDGARNVKGTRKDGKGDARELRMEIYSPPYLFAKNAAGADILDAAGKPVPAIRPEIEWTRAGCAYGQEFPIEIATPNQVKTVAVIRCSSATHAFNPDQRYVELVIDHAKTTISSLTVSGPPAPEYAPPGYYLLFVLNSAGTPSVGRFFRISAHYPLIEGYDGKERPKAVYDFGTIKLGETRKATFQFKNVGVGELKLKEPGVESRDFRDKPDPGSLDFGIPGHPKNIDLVLSPDTAAPGFTANLEVSFTPVELGLYSGYLYVTTNALDAGGILIDLTARVEDLHLEITPQGLRLPVLSFGAVPVGTTKSLQITVRNAGNVDAYVSDMILSYEVPAGQFQVPFVIADRMIGVGQVKTFPIAYLPTAVGEALAYVTLIAVSTPSPPLHQKQYLIEVGGVGTGPVIVFNPANLSFADQLIRTISPAQPVTLTNVGTAPLTIRNINVSNDFSQVNTCGTTLGAGQSCAISVSFRPGHAGPLTALLSIDSDAVGGFQPVVLSGTGLAEPIVTLSPASYDFGNQPVGTGGAAQTITVTNDGAAPLVMSGVNLIGANQHDFVMTADSCSGATVPPEGACTVSVQFKPGASGSRTADLLFSDNAGGSPQRVALNGTGTAAPACTLNPTSLAFGNQPVGTANAPRSVTLTNNGPTPLMVGNVEITGTSTGDFVVTSDSCRGTTVAPGGSCRVEMVFSPTAVGSRRAGLTFTDDAPNSPQTIPLDGTGVGPIVSIEPASLVFPGQPVGSFSQRQDVTLRNTGNAPLTITSITVSGDFKHDTSCGTTLVPGAFCQIRIVCSPQAAGTSVGTVTVVDNAEGSPHTIPLQGTGIVPLAVLSATTLPFGSKTVGSSSVQTITLTNAGSAPLIIGQANLSGANTSDFVKVADGCTGSVLHTGDSCSVKVRFAPTAIGSRSASLTFSDNADNSPQSVLLTGSGS